MTGISSITVRGVLFDLDGTLLDTEALSDIAVIKAFGESLPSHVRNELLAQPGWVLPWELKKQILGLRGAEWIPIVLQYGKTHWGVSSEDDSLPPPPTLGDFWNGWESNLNDLCGQVKACTGAAKLVDELCKCNIPLAIATSSRMASVVKKRQRHESMFQKMTAIVAGDDPAVKNGKPAPDMYIEAARRLGLDPSECLVFEDALSGVKAGKAAGCKVVAVPDPRMNKEIFTEIADVVLDDLWQFDGSQWGLDVDMTPASPN